MDQCGAENDALPSKLLRQAGVMGGSDMKLMSLFVSDGSMRLEIHSTCCSA